MPSDTPAPALTRDHGHMARCPPSHRRELSDLNFNSSESAGSTGLTAGQAHPGRRPSRVTVTVTVALTGRLTGDRHRHGDGRGDGRLAGPDGPQAGRRPVSNLTK